MAIFEDWISFLYLFWPLILLLVLFIIIGLPLIIYFNILEKGSDQKSKN